MRSLYARCQAGKPAVAAYQTSCMPKLRSASAQLQQEVVSPTFSVAADTSVQPKHQARDQPDTALEVANKVVRRQRKRPQTDEVIPEGAATPDAALQQTPKKKAKVRKALLSTLWTEEDLIPLRLKVEKLFTQLNELYEDPPCPLNYNSPFQLLVAVILSAQVHHAVLMFTYGCHNTRQLVSPHVLSCRAQTRKSMRSHQPYSSWLLMHTAWQLRRY